MSTANAKDQTIICPGGAGAYTGREDEFVWRLNKETNEWVVPTRQQSYIDWFLTPKYERVPKTFNEFCARMGVHPQTVYRWRKDKRFKDAMRRAAEEKNYSTESIQQVIDAVWTNAVNGDTKAAALYLQYVKELQPVTRVIVEDIDVKSLPPDQLAAMLEEQAEALRRL